MKNGLFCSGEIVSTQHLIVMCRALFCDTFQCLVNPLRGFIIPMPKTPKGRLMATFRRLVEAAGTIRAFGTHPCGASAARCSATPSGVL